MTVDADVHICVGDVHNLWGFFAPPALQGARQGLTVEGSVWTEELLPMRIQKLHPMTSELYSVQGNVSGLEKLNEAGP